jgi:type II secretory pathway pseudopilin PulG
MMRNKLILPLGIAVIGLLLAVAIPNFVKARGVASKNSCIENLKRIEAAKVLWAKDRNVTNSVAEPQASELFGESKYIRDTPACFLDGTYSIGKLLERPRCSVPQHTL